MTDADGQRASSWPAADRAGSAATSSPSRSTVGRCCGTPSTPSGRSRPRSSSSPRPIREPTLPPDVRVVRDAVAFEGPLAGLLGRASRGAARRSSWSSAATCRRWSATCSAAMLAELDAHGRVDAVVLERDGQARPLPMALRASRR